jgi:hypothetical protein
MEQKGDGVLIKCPNLDAKESAKRVDVTVGGGSQ